MWWGNGGLENLLVWITQMPIWDGHLQAGLLLPSLTMRLPCFHLT